PPTDGVSQEKPGPKRVAFRNHELMKTGEPALTFHLGNDRATAIRLNPLDEPTPEYGAQDALVPEICLQRQLPLRFQDRHFCTRPRPAWRPVHLSITENGHVFHVRFRTCVPSRKLYQRHPLHPRWPCL